MPRKRSYFDGPGRILGTGELVEPKCSVKKVLQFHHRENRYEKELTPS